MLKKECDIKLLRSFHQWKYISMYNDDSMKINCIDWHSTGDKLITSSDDGFIRIFNLYGQEVNNIPSKKHGCVLVQFMSDGNSAVLGSKYEEPTCETTYHHKIRHLDLNNRQFIHYYNGHEKQVTSISLNHHHNCILSSSLDQTVRLWDNRLNCDISAGDRSSLGTIRIPAAGIPFANFDPMGIIFAVGINKDSIRLYDIRNFGKGPFKVKLYKDYDDKEKDWKQLVFSPDGQKIAISTNGTKMRIIDAFSLEKILSLTGFSNELNIHLELSWTSDSRSLFCGSSMNFLNSFGSKQLPLYLFNIIDGSIVQKYNSNHHAPVQCVKFNPKYYILASACHDVSFWQPPIQS